MRRLVALLLLNALAAPVLAADEFVSDAPWRAGYVYSVYDPHYARPQPEVRRDRNARDHPLTLDGKAYARGFGCRCFSIVELDVPDGVTGISAVVGIDDENAGASGDTYFSVWAEDRRLWQSPALAREDPALAVSVPLRGARQIKLITDSQGYANADLADWCDVRWERGATAGEVSWRYLPQPGTWHVRAELHPFHLVYRGEDLPVTAVAAAPANAVLAYKVVAEGGQPAAEGRTPLSVAAAPGGARAHATLPLAKLPGGLYELELSLSSGGKAVAERRGRFGVIDSHAGKPTRGSLYGVNHHEFVSSYEPLAAAGVEWSRQWFCWAWIERRKGEWGWSWHDERMAAAKEWGIQTIGVLGGIGEPAWAAPEHTPAGQPTTHACPADMADWEQYVRRVATRYRGQVRVWESWNEISGLAERDRLGWSVAKYVDLHRRTYRILKEIDPRNVVLVSADTLRFVDRCLEEGLGDTFDGVVIHPYRPGTTPEAGCANHSVGNQGDVLAVFEGAQAWLEARKRPKGEVWATEIGWALTGKEWPTVSVETHGHYLPRTYLLAQASGKAANVCWHDFALGMFGICDGQGYPRPALLAFAGLVSRLSGAVPVERYRDGSALQGFRFRRDGRDVVALWTERGTEFALLKASRPVRADLFDSYGNARSLEIPAGATALPAGGSILYLEAPSLSGVGLARAEPVRFSPETAQVVAGHEATVTCRIENLFAAGDSFRVAAAPPEGLSASAPPALSIPRGKSGSAPILIRPERGAAPGERVVPVTVTLPDGLAARFDAHVRVLAPLDLSLAPFDTSVLGRETAATEVLMRNNDDRPLSGEVTLSAPAGFAITPAATRFAALAPGATAKLPVQIACARPPAAGDILRLRAAGTDGARAEKACSLSPVVLDADGDGLADGWRINPENTGKPEQRNVAEVSVEPGDAEFFCQKIHCTRFTSGWIIFHRDGKDRIEKEKRYRVTFRARQRDIEGTVGVAVYHIQPWDGCGPESHLRVGADWQTFTTEFTARRDSDNARFEFYFTETGTLWIEGMRLEPVG